MLFLAAALLVSSAHAAEEPAECPAGTSRTATGNPYQPFRCVKEQNDKGFGAVAGPRGFKSLPKCPRGTRAVAGVGLQPYRCAPAIVGGPDPEPPAIKNDEDAPAAGRPDENPLTLGCPRGWRKARTTDPLRPFQCMRQVPTAAIGAGAPPVGVGAYRRYAIAGELSLDYPSLFEPRDGWREEVPTLSFTLDDGSPGKPVMITITKVESAQPTFIDLDAAFAKDKDWQGAKDGGVVQVAGARARAAVVAGDSKTVYVPLSKAAYYTIVYSAPAEAYQTHLGAFEHLLKTLRLTRSRNGRHRDRR